MVALSKSPNKHNRIYVKAEPNHEETSLAIEAVRSAPVIISRLVPVSWLRVGLGDF